MVLTTEQLKKVFREASPRLIDLYLPHINNTLDEFEINTPARIQMFLGQIGHESGQLRYAKELASGTAYEGRKDLGNTSPGDGVRYKGRGLIQITGKHNYGLVSLALGLPLLEKPELLEQPENAVRSAGWYWYKKNLNTLADLGLYKLISYRINGGPFKPKVPGGPPPDPNGWADRVKLFNRAKDVI